MDGVGLRFLQSLAVIVTLAGCAPNKIYRDTYQACSVLATECCERALN